MKIRLLILFLLCLSGTIQAQQKKAVAKPKPAAVKATPPPTDKEIDELFRAGRYPETIDRINAKLKANPRDTVRIIIKMLSYAMLHNKEMAVATARQLYPQPDTAAIVIATLPTRLTTPVMKADGLWYEEEAIRLSDKSGIPYMMKAALLVDDSMYDQAREAATLGYAKATPAEKEELGGTFAQILQKSGDSKQAYGIMGGLTAKYPDNSEIAANYYGMLINDKKWSEAMTQLSHMMAIKPADSLRLGKERAFLYRDMGRTGDACAEAVRLAALDADYEPLLGQFGCPEAYADISPAKVKRYTYAVDFHGADYDFIVTPKTVSMDGNSSFSWKMTIREGLQGNTEISRAAMDTAHGQMNMFEGGDKSLTGQTAVWVSRAVYSELKGQGWSYISASEEGVKKFSLVPVGTGEEESEGRMVTLATGRNKLLKVLHARSGDGKEDIWINDDPRNPIITRLSIGWNLYLKSAD